MSELNIKGLVKNIKSRSNVYTPLIEAIVNSIQAIEDSQRKDGEIILTIKRSDQQSLAFDGDALPEIRSIEIQDNGIGFNSVNRDSFNTLHSDLKIEKGGKGFGRFMFLKYFESVSIESTFQEDNKYFHRFFLFGKDKEIIEDEKLTESTDKDIKTILKLNDLKGAVLDKKLETIAKKILEKLLIYFINDDYACPRIILREEGKREEIILNNYLGDQNHPEIQKVDEKTFILQNKENSETFQLKTFKVFYPHNQRSKISLAAHNREVKGTPLHHYVPEFEDDFYEEFGVENAKVKKDYIIKAYVLGPYLDLHVSLERDEFDFTTQKDLFFPFSQTDIESKAAELTRELFSDDVSIRREKKRKLIEEYVSKSAPWHISYLKDIDLSSVPYKINEEGIEMVLQKLKFQKEQYSKIQIGKLMKEEKGSLSEKIDVLIKEITEIGKSDLAHYVCNRKVVLDFLKKLLERNDDGSAKYESEVHNVIFPMGQDSTNTDYSDHNLWILDERLVFSQYVASDKKIGGKTSPTEPDLVIFDQKRSFRNGDNEFSNPLTIFEFKRPKRTEYSQDADPVLQIGKYLEEIRSGKYETPNGVERVKVNENTPIYGYVICDITEKIKEFAKINQLTISPDEEGYFGYHNGYKMYIEVISFKKLIKNADLRNKIFFHKLGL